MSLTLLGQGGGTGRRTGLKIPRWRHCVGSIPTLGTKKSFIDQDSWRK